GRLLFVMCIRTYPLQKPIASGLAVLDEALACSLQAGNLFHAAYSIHIMQQYLLECGTADQLLEHARRYRPLLLQTRVDVVSSVCRGLEQFARCLKGRTRGPAALDDDDFDEARHIAFLEAVPSSPGLFGFFTVKQVATYVAGM